ncbi:MAG: formate--tetrahydrofolate ligase [Gemmatimonadaceae bacterium]|jgi:formate--tetrahydrofolate ligase|nr:formate--tetrahydrofolate ligase [Gemmatimonadaceae bacterium]
MLSDLEIAQVATLRPIHDVAADLGVPADAIDPYGRVIAKLPLDYAAQPPRGKLVLVTAIHPTAAGEGKTTTSVGLAQALRRLGTNTVLCLREPSLGPVFGVKGGAAGGGRAQVLPMEELNLHFTGDFHAITSAHALLAALLDNHLHQGNALGIDPRRISWPRTVDMNDRALRDVVIGLGGAASGVPRQERFVITPASEVMAVTALASDLHDLEARLGRIIVGSTRDRRPVTAADLGAAGAMTLLLKQALRPNLVQTLEGGPALVHCGPFANIAHGCNSLVATRTALALGDVVVTEAGFGSDLGAEKFFDIKARAGGLRPAAAVVVATVRALKLHGGARKDALATPDVAAVERGIPNLARHIANVRAFGVPVVVAVNRFPTDAEAELQAVADACAAAGAQVALSEVWAHGGAGGEALARAVLGLLAGDTADFTPAYDVAAGIREKVETIVTRVYGGRGADFTPKAERQVAELERIGLGATPVCIAKTQYSFSDDPTRVGAPTDFRITINEVYPAAGAGFVVALAGDIMTMPGLPASPSAERIGVGDDGRAFGLF